MTGLGVVAACTLAAVAFALSMNWIGNRLEGRTPPKRGGR